ncbi:MAG: sigma-70 family RNA polymerase sigma factor [Pseudomonadota bacterium]
MQAFLSQRDSGRSLSALLSGVADGETRALAQLYAQTSPMLYAICLRMLRHQDLAAKTLRTTYVQIWNDLTASGQTPEHPKSWLITQARNAAITALRRSDSAGLKPELLDDDALPAFVNPDKVDGGNPERSALMDRLATLDDSAREMLFLAYFDGYTRDDLAARYDRPATTIKTWLRDALTHLRADKTSPGGAE